jgi:hypothetical protein
MTKVTPRIPCRNRPIGTYALVVIVGITGALVGRVDHVRPHPRGELIWLARIDLGPGTPPVQMVFGGDHELAAGDLVPVAPPGSHAIEAALRRQQTSYEDTDPALSGRAFARHVVQP